MDGVVTVVENNGQFQVVIGNTVASVYQEFEDYWEKKINNLAMKTVKRYDY